MAEVAPAVMHRGALRRQIRPSAIARRRAAGIPYGEGPCGLCGTGLVFSPEERLEGSTLVCGPCFDDVLTAASRQHRPVAIGLPGGRRARILVKHDTECPAPQGGPCGEGCEPDVTLLLGGRPHE